MSKNINKPIEIADLRALRQVPIHEKRNLDKIISQTFRIIEPSIVMNYNSKWVRVYCKWDDLPGVWYLISKRHLGRAIRRARTFRLNWKKDK